MPSLQEDQPQEVRTIKKKKNMKKHLVHLFLLPALLFYIVFQIYPIFTAFLNSFYSFNGFTRDAFIGIQNFVTLLTQSPYKETFTNALNHNWIVFVVSFFSKLVVAFILALLLHSKIKGREFFKSVFFIPKLLSVIVIGFLFSLILNPTNGALNSFLRMIGLDNLAMPWLGSTDTALYTIILVNSWSSIGFAMLIFLAGLQAIDDEIFEAARIDGARGLTMIFKITVPMVLPALMIMTILTFISSFEIFELIFAMQGSSGGPYYSTDVLATYFYRLAFGSVEGGQAIGLGSALAVILFFIIASVTAISLFFFQRKNFER
ncbi:carbohydrate ABC transporter permease [Bacillus horti]|uniref:Raffinose/stachyose/melibiose transport system permease protein n=1 Tax=Caldalkalibacillus horti TaxID=77523 RepID=A0ABT9VZR2_9BACI|nr:sugar ABC transporter permease [Bacillus horti]MDQ0166307.1 raffinose/stachyose/melibiose transport system permease protein [Bacillus horti]